MTKSWQDWRKSLTSNQARKASMTKEELLTDLRWAGIETVVAEYSGSGDEGCIDAVELRSALMPTGAYSGIEEGVGAFIYDETRRHGLDWCNNEGGGGVLTINVAEGTAHFEHYNNIETTEEVPFDV